MSSSTSPASRTTSTTSPYPLRWKAARRDSQNGLRTTRKENGKGKFNQSYDKISRTLKSESTISDDSISQRSQSQILQPTVSSKVAELSKAMGNTYEITEDGKYTPLSLFDYATRSICVQLSLAHSFDYEYYSHSTQSNQGTQDQKHTNSSINIQEEYIVNQDEVFAILDDEMHRSLILQMRLQAQALPTEIINAILQWLKRHEVLDRDQFQALLWQLNTNWNLQGLRELQSSWFDGIPESAYTQLRHLNVSNCVQLEALGSQLWLQIDSLPNLKVANFQGCLHLQPSVVESLVNSMQLVSLNLSRCRNIDDQCLYALRSLVNLKHLDLSGCRELTDDGLIHLSGLSALTKLSLSHCTNISSTSIMEFPICFPKLESLDIAHCSLSNIGLRAIGRIASIQSLVLRCCKAITDSGIQSLTSLTSLQYLDVRRCDEVYRLPTAWPSLRVVLLTKTAFTEFDYSRTATIPNLQEIDLRGCRLTNRGFDALYTFSKLEKLVLAETSLTDQVLLRICEHCKELKALDVSHTDISDVGTANLSNLKNLEILLLDAPGVSNLTLARVSKLHKLQHLDLFGARISDDGLTHLKKLKNLKVLECCSGSISDRGVESISKISSLTSLNLSQNRHIHGRSLYYLQKLIRLKSLNLSDTRISPASLQYLHSLKCLETLSIYSCPLTSKHIDDLQAILPQLRCLRCS